MQSPTIKHWTDIKRILRYISETLYTGIHIRKSPAHALEAFSDSDWGEILQAEKAKELMSFIGALI